MAKKEKLEEQIAHLVGAGKEVKKETVDFSDPNRPLTCLEVDFPIIPVNSVATIEGNAGKPIYQMSKWWARRRSSVFRSLLLAAAMKAPEDPANAAKEVWEVYYANHQKKGAFQHLQVADIFMGGGTTLVEGSRLGMQMHGNDLNPVAWLVVKNELAQIDEDEVRKMFEHIEAEVKPQIMPYYTCDCPRGHKGKWTEVATGKVMDEKFDPLTIAPEDRKKYRYEGPEVIYTFWAKHGPCQVTGCGHRTPIMSSPVVAEKTLTVKCWPDAKCEKCGLIFDVEQNEARMAPGVPLAIDETEKPYAILNGINVKCPKCGHINTDVLAQMKKTKNKKVALALLVHPEWLKGCAPIASDGRKYGGSATDTPEATALWNQARAKNLRLLEVRGKLSVEVTCPSTKVTFKTGPELGSNKGQGKFVCAACGTKQKFVDGVEKTHKTAPVAILAIQGFCPACSKNSEPYNGRFFAPFFNIYPVNRSYMEWEERKNKDLKHFWPENSIPFGHMTHQRQPLPQHGYLNWWMMFNPRQLLLHSQLLKNIVVSKNLGAEVKTLIIGAFQQYLRNQNMFCFWNPQRDTLEPFFSNNNYHPKSTVVENSVFPNLGRGNWASCVESLINGIKWASLCWETVSVQNLVKTFPDFIGKISGKSCKVYPGDPITNDHDVRCCSSTELAHFKESSIDLVITDPPFGDNVQYSELADFFYVWLRLALKDRYPEIFSNEYSPKTLEAVSNKARHPDDPDEFYQRVLTECWKEAHRILKPGGILAFTFHHSEDEPWVAVLESIFEAGFYLVATYPIRSDETKGAGEFGSKKIEYDIIHVCRKRLEGTKSVSWARMRRQVMQDIQQLKGILEHHQQQGLAAADIKVIKRGKALEYFSRHYGKVYAEEGRSFTVQEALAGINQILDEELESDVQAPPVEAEPFTRQFLRLFYKKSELPRDQMQKHLRGTGVSPDDFVKRGWCTYKKKMFTMVSPDEIAEQWKGKPRSNMNRDYEQMMFLIGACFEQSGINVRETLNNPRFKPHPATMALLKWMGNHGASDQVRNAAQRAERLYLNWQSEKSEKVNKQMELFDFEEE